MANEVKQLRQMTKEDIKRFGHMTSKELVKEGIQPPKDYEPRPLVNLVGTALALYGHLDTDQLYRMGYQRTEQVVPQATKDYWWKVYDKQPTTLSDDQIKSIIRSKLAKSAKQVGKKFVPDDAQLSFMSLLFLYCKKYQESRINIEKGLLVSGDVGIGKTSILTAFLTAPFQPYSLSEPNPDRVKIVSAITLVDWYNYCQDNNLNWKERYQKDELYITDLGSEPKGKYQEKGGESVLAKLIEHRYNMNAKTHYCTNLTKNEIERKYGQRVSSRLAGTTNYIDLRGEGITKDYRLEEN